jgi:large subunit ribosomal protein L23
VLLSSCNPYQVIKSTIFTEKSQMLVSDLQYSFFVDKQSTKKSIADAIEKIYNVKVLKVRVMNYKSRKTASNKGYKTVSGFKKAIVFLKKGYNIDFEKIID